MQCLLLKCQLENLPSLFSAGRVYGYDLKGTQGLGSRINKPKQAQSDSSSIQEFGIQHQLLV